MEEKARQARLKVLEMIHLAGSSHIGSNFSCIDILTVLFEKIDLSKDIILFSKGWIAASAYYFLAEKGVIPKEDLKRFCQPGEIEYIGLVEPTVKGIKFAGGSVGYGISAGVGMALAKKMKKEEGKVYVLESDGAMDVGMNWEAALIAAHHKLDNFVVIVDYNGFQATGKVEDILKIDDLRNKWNYFGWMADQMDGHNHKLLADYIFDVIDDRDLGCPTVVIADTIKGKGVSFMENKLEWHYRNVDLEHYEKAKAELCQN